MSHIHINKVEIQNKIIAEEFMSYIYTYKYTHIIHNICHNAP